MENDTQTPWEGFIRQHAAGFDTRPLPAGHEERFLSRLEASGRKPGRRRVLRTPFFSRAVRFSAAFALGLLALVLAGQADPAHYFFAVPNEPGAIYRAYLDRMARLYAHLPWERQDIDPEAALQGIVEAGTPLFEQLPEELPKRKKSRILKSHYGKLLAAAEQSLENTH